MHKGANKAFAAIMKYRKFIIEQNQSEHLYHMHLYAFVPKTKQQWSVSIDTALICALIG